MRKHLLSTAAGTLALLGVAGSAQAYLITGNTPGTYLTIEDIIPTSITGGPVPLDATVTFANATFGSGGTTFSTLVTITNNTGSTFPSGRLTALGFNINPDTNTGSLSDTSIFNVFFDGNFPSFGSVDVCTSTGPNCAGGGGGDLAAGASTSFTLQLTGLPASATPSLDLGARTAGAPEVFDFKWQTGIGSFESSCTYGASCGTVVVPEPASLALLGTGLLGLGLIGRRRRKI